MSDAGSFADVNVENLKVIEIKKRLKALGLPVTGNKPELVERLKAALIAKRDVAAPSDTACDFSPNKVEDLVPEDTLPSEVMIEDNEALEKSEEVDLSEDLDESFQSKDSEIDLKGNEDLEMEDFRENDDSNQSQDFAHSEEVGKFQDAQIVQMVSTTIVPSIKRCSPLEEVETVKPMKKIVLKRNNFPTPILAAKVGKADEAEVSQSGPIAEKSDIVAEKPNESRKNIITLTSYPYRGLSESAKQEKRAIRFNQSCRDFTEKRIAEIDRDNKISATLNLVNKKSQYSRHQENKQYSRSQQNMQKTVKLSGSYPAPSLDVLKKRAERFGGNVSSVLKKLEDEEKLNQRKIKFGIVSSGAKDTDEEEKKRKRAERFGK